MYRCVATSVAGFVQQLAVAYLTHGYYFYVTCRIPESKDPRSVDHKIISRYGIDVSAHTRARRKRRGLANIQYLRHGNFFIVLATKGEHLFFEAEGLQVLDVRRRPIQFGGYSIGCRPGRGSVGPLHASVRIARDAFRELKGCFERQAVHRSVEQLCRELREIPFEPYAPIRSQLCVLFRALNRRRKAAGLELLPGGILRLQRRSVRPFGTIRKVEK